MSEELEKEIVDLKSYIRILENMDFPYKDPEIKELRELVFQTHDFTETAIDVLIAQFLLGIARNFFGATEILGEIISPAPTV